MKKMSILLFALFLTATVFGQKDFYKNKVFTKADTLRGQLRPERTCYDVTFYDLNVAIDIDKRFLKGFVDIHYDVVEDFEALQIDLFENMTLDKVFNYSKLLSTKRVNNAVFVYFSETQKAGTSGSIRVFYEGFPTGARNAPWDGGFVWNKDENGDPWVGVACEGDGASLWWPNKDHLSDEPDSMSIRVAVPTGLTCVANGNLRGTKTYKNGFSEFHWFVSYPINNYNVTVNIGKYEHFSDTYTAQDGEQLQMDFYVMPYNLEKAKVQFAQVKDVLKANERFFGKYPFWNDGLAFVETPYLGMEHQGAIAYGNKYMRGYLGGMIPRDMNWDYIIVHELGHEWWGNSISTNDHAEMWIHESFTTYMEALFVEDFMSKKDAIRYLGSQKGYISNREPLLGPLDVNWDNWSASDHYYKGAWMLHTLRNAINDDEKWFEILKGLYQNFKMSNVTTKDIVDYINEATTRDYSLFFEQYLEYPSIPKLIYDLKQDGNKLTVRYRWEADVAGFDMPIMVGKEGAWTMISPTTNTVGEVVLDNINKSDFEVADKLFYVRTGTANLKK
jgi:aminopeptidase N